MARAQGGGAPRAACDACIDAATPERHPLVGVVKDVLPGRLVSAAGAARVSSIVFLARLGRRGFIFDVRLHDLARLLARNTRRIVALIR